VECDDDLVGNVAPFASWRDPTATATAAAAGDVATPSAAAGYVVAATTAAHRELWCFGDGIDAQADTAADYSEATASIPAGRTVNNSATASAGSHRARSAAEASARSAETAHVAETTAETAAETKRSGSA